MRPFSLLLLLVALTSPAGAQLPDRDADGIPDELDNCVDLPNPDQVDSTAGVDDDSSLPGVQAYGTVCDPDLDDDGGVDAIDRLFQLGCLRGTPPAGFDCADADLVGAGLDRDPDPMAVAVNAFDRFQMLRWFRTPGSRPGRAPDTFPVPGLSGDRGDDLTLDHLYELETFESLPGWPRFYFSADPGGLLPEGDDANPCTLDEPCKSASLMEDPGSGAAWLDVARKARLRVERTLEIPIGRE